VRKGSIQEAIEKLAAGEVVGFPTETVYGLAGRMDQIKAIEKIFSVKKRPFFDPLIVHVDSVELARNLTEEWNDLAQVLAENFWPGPLTMVLKKSSEVSDLITAGLTSVGLRMPSHPMALEMIKGAGCALAAPSANRFGKTSPTKADHVLSEFPEYDSIVVDGGDCEIGLESTVLSIEWNDNQKEFEIFIHRRGAVLESQVLKVLDQKGLKYRLKTQADRRLSPGHMKHHYMPEIPLVVVENASMSESQILAAVQKQIKNLPDKVEEVEIRKPQKFERAVEIVLPTTPDLAARQFYSLLREKSEKGNADLLFARWSQQEDLEEWKAIADRLFKAASLVLR
jgi:L-threonylcarbamoyladenylate synthase